jgi:tight adherence protein C
MTPEVLLAVSGMFVTVAILAGSTASWWLARNAPEQRRLRNLAPVSTTGVVAVTEKGALTEGVDATLANLSRYVPKSPKEMSRLQRRLARAGYPQYKSVIYYSLAELILPVALALLVVLIVGLQRGWIFALLAGGIGYLMPSFYIGKKTKQRQKAIQNGLPDALDLLTVCVEAGSGLDQAVVKTCDELHIAHPALATEMRFVTTEIRAGKPRAEAFKNFAARTGVEDVRALVSVLAQTDRFGTSIAQALRTHAETSRTKRRQRAEERAGKVGVKLVFPLALCLFPALYIVCFGPVVVQVYRAFFTSGM